MCSLLTTASKHAAPRERQCRGSDGLSNGREEASNHSAMTVAESKTLQLLSQINGVALSSSLGASPDRSSLRNRYDEFFSSTMPSWGRAKCGTYFLRDRVE